MSSSNKQSRYFLLPSLPFSLRFALVAALVVIGLWLQLQSMELMPGLLVVLGGSILMFRRGLSESVTITQKKAEWKKVDLEKWQQFLELQNTSAKLSSSWTNINSSLGVFVMIFSAVIVFILSSVFAELEVESMFLLPVNAAALLIPMFFSGGICSYTDSDVRQKLRTLLAVIEFLKDRHPGITPEPMFAMKPARQGEDKGTIPTDAKLMLKLEGQPSTFYGIQVNCNLNKVGGTAYPYVYAVVLTAPDFPVRSKALPQPKNNLVLQKASSNAEATYIVLRWKTTRTSGYHTKEGQQHTVLDCAIALAESILKNRN